MNMLMLAEITQLVNNADPYGLLCLASILFIIIAIICYTCGWLIGSFNCAVLWIISVCVAEDAISFLPLWAYHPASPCYIFGFFGLPAIFLFGLINDFVSKKG